MFYNICIKFISNSVEFRSMKGYIMLHLKRILAILLCVILALPITACSSTGDAYLYFELTETPQNLDPQTASSDSELLIVKNTQEGLMRKDAEGDIVCGIAKSYTLTDLTYTFYLRDDACWNNGDRITAYDFEFALKRAVDPTTAAPFASTLFSITGAKEINEDKTADLAVKALDELTLQITLKEADDRFLETLTTSIAMPCNSEFFYSTDGKYGLGAEYLLSSGSYRLGKWNKESFGIRLYKNKEYTGFAKPQNAAVFITCVKDETAYQRLQKNTVDMIFLDTTLIDDAKESGFEVKEFQNICWVLTLGNQFSANMRKAFCSLVSNELYHNNLPEGYTSAVSIFPNIFTSTVTASGLTSYNAALAKQLYLEEVELLEGKKFPSDVVLYYYENGDNLKNVTTDIVGHWQSNFSAFINIEAVYDITKLENQLTKNNLYMAIFPVKTTNGNITEYLKNFGFDYSGQELSAVQSEILADNTVFPLMFQSTAIAYSSNLTNVVTELGNGYIDFSFIVKYE